jgi:hypothetical protein
LSVTFLGEHFLKLVVPGNMAYEDDAPSNIPDFLEFCGIDMYFEFGYYEFKGKFNELLAKVNKSSQAPIE